MQVVADKTGRRAMSEIIIIILRKRRNIYKKSIGLSFPEVLTD